MGGERAAKRQCALVLTELRKTEALPEGCRTMLVNMAEPTLTTCAADRHPFQVQAVEMVSKTFTSIETELGQAIAHNQTKVDSADAEKASRAAALSTAEAKLAELQQGATGAKDALDADIAAEKQAKSDMAEAMAKLKESEDEFASSEKKKGVLEDTTNLYGLLKTAGHEAQGRKSAKRVMSVLADFELEEFVVKSVGEALCKEAADRGTFDGVVLKHVDAKLTEWAGEVESSLKSGSDSKDGLTKAKTAAEETHAAAGEKINASKTAYQAATTALSEGKQVFKEAEAAVKSFEKDMTTAAKSLESAKASLLSFKEGPLKAFAELKDLAPPPEPQAPVEESAEGKAEAVAHE
jgi:chromosome segregation ATPase